MLKQIYRNCNIDFFAIVILGDIFSLNVTRTWEFQPSFPVRSIVPIYVFVGLPLLLLRWLTSVFGQSLLCWYTLTTSVRATLVLLSFVIDWCAYRLSRNHGQSGFAAAAMISSSFVALVFYTRPLSNTIESLLFSLLVYMTMSISYNKNDSLSVDSKTSHHNLRQSDQQRTNIYDTLFYSLLIVMGIFNRPTFAVFALVPVIRWTFIGLPLSRTKNCIITVTHRCFQLLFSSLAFFAIFVISDSVYFGRLKPDISHIIAEVDRSGLWTTIQANITTTPVNFFLYNTRIDNLADHGLHPRFTHTLINIPLLFGPLGLLYVVELGSTVFGGKCRIQNVANRRSFLLLCILVPLSLLSVFPHQEPRFLIPLLLPFCLLFSSQVWNSKLWSTLWIAFNLLGCLFFGVFHQGGVVQSLGHLQQKKMSSSSGKTLAIFWHTYMPPLHLLLLPKSATPANDVTGSNASLEVYDFAGKPLDDVLEFLEHLPDSGTSSSNFESNKVVLLSPCSLHYDLKCLLGGRNNKYGFRIDRTHEFWPHFSTEDPPRLSDLLCLNSSETSCVSVAENCRTMSFVERLKLQTSLCIYAVLRPT